MSRGTTYQYIPIDGDLSRPGAFGVFETEGSMQARSEDPIYSGTHVGEALGLSEKYGTANAKLVEAVERRMREHSESDRQALEALILNDEGFQDLWDLARRERLALSEEIGI